MDDADDRESDTTDDHRWRAAEIPDAEVIGSANAYHRDACRTLLMPGIEAAPLRVGRSGSVQQAGAHRERHVDRSGAGRAADDLLEQSPYPPGLLPLD